MHLVLGKIFELVDLVFDLERRRQVFHRWMRGIFHFDGNLLMPRVHVKVSADQFAVFRPLVECIRGAMNADKSFARPNKIQECRFLFCWEGQLTSRIEHKTIKVLQIV